MKFIRRARRLGGSLTLTLDSEICNVLNIQKDDFLEVDIRKRVEQEDLPLTEFRCKACEHRFAQNDEVAFCPSCESESLEVVDVEDVSELNNETTKTK